MRKYLAYVVGAAMVAMGLTGCVMGPPQIAQDESMRGGLHSEGWNQVLDRNFPAGESEKELQARLRREGFLVMPSHHAARYSWGVVPCEHVLEVRWEADETGKLVEVIGEYDELCIGDEYEG